MHRPGSTQSEDEDEFEDDYDSRNPLDHADGALSRFGNPR
jgi:hypothetical protein